MAKKKVIKKPTVTSTTVKKVVVKKLVAKPKSSNVIAPNNRKISAIKRAINRYISTDTHRSDLYVNPSNWYVGVTNNAHIRKVQHQKQKNISALYFHSWDAGTLADALKIEKHFHDIGMRDKHSVGGVRENTIYVYVFKINPNMLDEVAYLLGIVE